MSDSSDWKEATDLSTGKVYYYNSAGQTSWDPPPSATTQEADAVLAPSGESSEAEDKTKGTESVLSRRTERLIDQIYESTWNFKALRSLGGSSEEVVAITKALRDNFSITAVYDMRHTDGVDDEACRSLASALRLNHTVTKLALDSDRITNEGIKHLASMLDHEDCAICKMSLWCSSAVKDQGAQYLANALKVGAGYLADAARMNHLIQKLSVESGGIQNGDARSNYG